MSDRPPTDYIKSLIPYKTKEIKTAEKEILNGVNIANAEKRLVDSARSLAKAINSLIGRNALTDDDIEMIIIQSKKDAGLL